MKIYAVKVPNGQWRLAVKAKGADYGFSEPALDVWSEQGSTAFIGNVGNGEDVVLLEETTALPSKKPVTCCNCGAPVDTREVDKGGDPHGAQFSDGDWVCSSDCWDVAK